MNARSAIARAVASAARLWARWRRRTRDWRQPPCCFSRAATRGSTHLFHCRLKCSLPSFGLPLLYLPTISCMSASLSCRVVPCVARSKSNSSIWSSLVFSRSAGVAFPISFGVINSGEIPVKNSRTMRNRHTQDTPGPRGGKGAPMLVLATRHIRTSFDQPSKDVSMRTRESGVSCSGSSSVPLV
eukprot:scaffold73612_cov109-Phaeocystis_antarctica.AAC.1